ncbi:MAG: glucose-1-phosphate thymidylyltransferase [Bacteroidetes bacterium]|nr:glucose-1-phosphate thymidylyltransferase [Bacteroidota bacterium]
MQPILFDDHSWANLLPLTFTRPAADLRVGILTIAEKWSRHLETAPSYLTQTHLSGKFFLSAGEDMLLINGTLLPGEEIILAIQALQEGASLKKGDTLLGARIGSGIKEFSRENWIASATEYTGEVNLVDFPWKIFKLNGQEIEADMKLLTSGRESEKLSDTVRTIAPENIFTEPGFKGEHITLNAATGPIYLGRDTEIMEGSVIRGPFALCEGSTVKLSAKIYGPTTIGPHSKVGGEVNNCVIHSNSNKGHDGFLGNSVIGEWCNLGADTNNSNLKNNYSEVKIWNYPKNRFTGTGLQFCGLIMGDHSKCGINTMFNTGTVVGVSANIFGSGFPRNFIPSFSWGGEAGMSTYIMEKSLETASLVLERRDLELTKEDRVILQWIFDYSEKYRK